MPKVFLIGHTGSINRGCEAIVRSTVKLLNMTGINDIYLMSYETSYDKRLGVDKLCYYLPYNAVGKFSFSRLFFGGIKKVFKISVPLEKKRLKPLLEILEKDDIVLTIGGDTFCYEGQEHLFIQQKLIKAKGAKSILWSCSLDDKMIDERMLKHLMEYDYIMPREQITYETLQKRGIKKEKLIKMSDSAFNLDYKEVKEYADLKNTVGVNISPIVVKNERTYAAIIKLIRYIIENLKMKVLLIPHVYDADIQDDSINRRIKKDLKDVKGLGAVKNFYSCEEIKYIISKCSFFVGARTHAMIAAYSSGVPALALGYSVKSRGIARDIFGDEKGYAVMYDEISDENILIELFSQLVKNEKKVLEIYKNKMPEYRKTGINAAMAIKNMCGKTKTPDKVYFGKVSCSGCGVCAEKCPEDCIEMKSDKYGFKYPVIDMEKCINCGICRKVCPIKNKPETNGPQAVYAAYSTDEELRKNSSSGGMFGLLARKILDLGGAVFGAGFDNDFKVVHKCAVDIKELPELYGSKYVQSDLKNSFSLAKQYLDEGKTVLFSGTPCQIGGLKNYLGKAYDNLFTVDFICHGVPAPMAWEKYKEKRLSESDAEIKAVSFRDKNFGWKHYSLRVDFKNEKIYTKININDSYLKSFILNLTLRDSCISCAFKGKEGVSDITLADFWGIENYIDSGEYVSDKGVSAVIVRNEKGKNLFNSCSEIILKDVSIDKVISGNPSLVKSVNENPLRQKFMDKMLIKDYDALVKKYCGTGIFAKIKRFAARIFA